MAAESEKERLTALLAPLRVGLVHGRMRPADRDAEMTRFRDGELDVLVGTTVVEVGVDVPEATMMIVEGAERFGLAQLHQLRGRVGRGLVESFCVLVSDSEDPVARARLKALVETQDGFALAEEDFKLRREGDVLGFAQSGFPRLRVASLQRDDHRELAVVARQHAETLIDEDGELRPEAGPELGASCGPAGCPAWRRPSRRRGPEWRTGGRVCAGSCSTWETLSRADVNNGRHPGVPRLRSRRHLVPYRRARYGGLSGPGYGVLVRRASSVG